MDLRFSNVFERNWVTGPSKMDAAPRDNADVARFG